MWIFNMRVKFLISVLLLLTLVSWSHGLQCYSNEKRKNRLRTKDGKDDLVTCESSAECYETVLNDGREKSAAYTAGCTACETSDDVTCYSCKAPLCNNHHANEIKKANRQCYMNGDKATFGSKTVYCSKGVKECYYEEVNTASNKVHYIAGCGSPLESCSKEFCKVCTQNLCNLPDAMKTAVSQRRKTTMNNEGGDTDAKKDAKKPCKKNKSGEGGETEKDEEDDDCDDDDNEVSNKVKEATDGDNGSVTLSHASFTVVILLLAAANLKILV